MVTTAAVREHYDSLAFIYQTFWGDHLHHGLFDTGIETPEEAQVHMVDYCAGLADTWGKEVLDVGCGHGGTAIRLARTYDCMVLGITISEKQARIARDNIRKHRLRESVSVIVQDAETFDYPDASYDLVWTMESSEHFQDKNRYFRNVACTLRSGGKLLLTAWTGSMKNSRVRAVADAFLCPELWPADAYIEVIEKAGMRVTHQEDLTAKVVQTWNICRQRAQSAASIVKLLPRSAREFIGGIDVILDAYNSGALTYTVVTGMKA
jgi:tocopherol O-methyltransferase